MVAEFLLSQSVDLFVISENNVKVFFENDEYGIGTLHVKESKLSWESATDEKRITLEYPSISLHAISKDTSNFPHECIYCLLEASNLFETDEQDPYPKVTQVRFVPQDQEKLKSIYDAIAHCQTLHPDEDDDSINDDEQEPNYEQFPSALLGEGFYTADSNFDDIELSEEGQAVMLRLQQNMNISNVKNEDNESHQPSGQFDYAE